MTVANTGRRSLPQLDSFLEQAVRELEDAIADISVNAAILDLQLAHDPAQAALRVLVRDLRLQALHVSRVLDAALDGERRWS